MNDVFAGWGLALLRVTLGIVFAAHGIRLLLDRGFSGLASDLSWIDVPMPQVSAVVVIASLTVGGAMFVLGLYARWAAPPIIVVMAAAAMKVHHSTFFTSDGGFEYDLVLAVGAAAVMLAGPGALALDSYRTAAAGRSKKK